MRFVDEVEVVVQSGRGGAGRSSFRREAYVPFGGPDGGDGGRGGHVIFEADSGVNTLLDLKSRPVWRAEEGGGGGQNRRNGSNGADLVVKVPAGTLVFDAETGAQLMELTTLGERRVVAEGGKGGLGNIHFKTSTNRTPQKATPGGTGTTLKLRLELKLMADVGLLGYPNAGKSTLISVISAARPRVADYPFTTLTPNLGVVTVGMDSQFVVADIPGLVEGAAEGRGLGLQFLRHVERTRLLVHLLSLGPDEGEPPAVRYRVLRNELARYSDALAGRPELVVLTKRDTLDDEALAEVQAELAAAGVNVVATISAVQGEGVTPLVREIWKRLLEIPRDHVGDAGDVLAPRL